MQPARLGRKQHEELAFTSTAMHWTANQQLDSMLVLDTSAASIAPSIVDITHLSTMKYKYAHADSHVYFKYRCHLRCW
jgi:hypothetical protein